MSWEGSQQLLGREGKGRRPGLGPTTIWEERSQRRLGMGIGESISMNNMDDMFWMEFAGRPLVVWMVVVMLGGRPPMV